jgi:eukaryotic-like serine/threonine-protein kinase
VAPVDERIAERYELKNAVGKGGMSTVYCAYDTQLERTVALKILHEHFSEDDDYVARFRHEARAAAQLSHPGIVTVIDRGEADGRQFIVFEFVEGETLKDLVVRGGPMPIRRVLEVGLQVGRALAFAHQQGLIHRDVKPQNVLMNGDGRAKVTDFGIARSLEAVGGRTETGTVLGTSHYIAPEQARGERVDAQTDVYSFGVVLYELLAGDVPYEGDNFLTVALQHVNEPVPSVLAARPEAPLRLAALVERCLAKSSSERPGSMADVVAELESCLAELDSPDTEATMIVRTPVAQTSRPEQKRSRSRRISTATLALIGLALALLAAAVLGVVLLRGDQDRGATTSAGGEPVSLRGVASYDPDGGDGEHDDEAGLATDGNLSTFWRTERYDAQLSLIKSGVGLVLASGGSAVETLTVSTDTPGFTAEIRAGESPTSFGDPISAAQTLAGKTTFELDDTDARFLLLWITELDSGSAHVNEVTAAG